MQEPTSRDEAMLNGIVVHVVGVDPWEHAQDAMSRGCYVEFHFPPEQEETEDDE